MPRDGRERGAPPPWSRRVAPDYIAAVEEELGVELDP
jgi:hypothetical protein